MKTKNEIKNFGKASVVFFVLLVGVTTTKLHIYEPMNIDLTAQENLKNEKEEPIQRTVDVMNTEENNIKNNG